MTISDRHHSGDVVRCSTPCDSPAQVLPTRRQFLVAAAGTGVLIGWGFLNLPESSPRSTGWFLAPSTWPAWKSEFVRCASPGPRVRHLLDTFSGNPAEKLAQSYSWLVQNLRYVPIQTERDVFLDVETWLALSHQVGNCVQAAIFLTSAGGECGFPMRIVCTRSAGATLGHVQAQVLIGRKDAQSMWTVWAPDSKFSLRNFPGHELLATDFLPLDGGLPPADVPVGKIEAVLDVQPLNPTKGGEFQ